MMKEVISKKQMQILIFTFPIGVFLLFSEGADVKQDAWIASLIAILISIVILKMYEKLMGLYPGKNLYDIIDIVFGKYFGSALNIIFILHSIILASSILSNFTNFINLTALWNTPKIIPMVLICILVIWILKKGIHTLVNWTKVNIALIFISVFSTMLFLIPRMEISNLQPVFEHSFKEISKSSFSISMLAFVEVFIFLGFFDYLQESNLKDVFIKPIILAGVLGTFILVINLTLIGPQGYSSFYYSGYEAVKKMHLAGEYQRFEVIVSVLFTMARLMELSFSILAACKGVERLFNLSNYRNALVPIVLIVLNFSYIMYGSVMNAMDFLREMWTFYAFIIQVFLVSLVFIAALIRRRV